MTGSPFACPGALMVVSMRCTYLHRRSYAEHKTGDGR